MTDKKEMKIDEELTITRDDEGIGSIHIDSGSGEVSVNDGTTWKKIASGTFTSGAPTTTTTPVWAPGGMITTTAGRHTKKPAPSKTVPVPTKAPRKLLIAFLDEHDEVEWCAKVHPKDMSVDYGDVSGAPEMSFSFFLIEAD